MEERGGGDILTLWPFVPQSVAGCAPRSRSLCVWEETMPGGGGGAGPGQRQPPWRCAVPVWQRGRLSKKDPPTFQVYLSWQGVYTVQ